MSENNKNNKGNSPPKASNENNELLKDLERLKAERDEYLEGWQRERANFINYKKEEKTRFKEIVSFSNERLIKSLITVVDSFNLAIQSFVKQGKSDEENESYLKGIYLIKSQLEDILAKEGVEIIEAKPGEDFDPRIYEAVVEVESKEFKPNTIVEVLEKGYVLNGKILRPCRVMVAKEVKE
ncbi:MAG: nucleotide exchange factor GrpE [Candidatus Pacebacteria bacterium]|nr:nucleotide exchange factor GrpE [Candidatus Paceibacterota bacterium]